MCVSSLLSDDSLPVLLVECFLQQNSRLCGIAYRVFNPELHSILGTSELKCNNLRITNFILLYTVFSVTCHKKIFWIQQKVSELFLLKIKISVTIELTVEFVTLCHM